MHKRKEDGSRPEHGVGTERQQKDVHSAGSWAASAGRDLKAGRWVRRLYRWMGGWGWAGALPEGCSWRTLDGPQRCQAVVWCLRPRPAAAQGAPDESGSRAGRLAGMPLKWLASLRRRQPMAQARLRAPPHAAWPQPSAAPDRPPRYLAHQDSGRALRQCCSPATNQCCSTLRRGTTVSTVHVPYILIIIPVQQSCMPRQGKAWGHVRQDAPSAARDEIRSCDRMQAGWMVGGQKGTGWWLQVVAAGI